MTNYEKIKNMSVEEMAKIIERSADCEKYCVYTKHGNCDGTSSTGCIDGVKQWLESEATK